MQADVNAIPVNPNSPYECYWSKRALEAERRLAEALKLVDSLKAENAVMREDFVYDDPNGVQSNRPVIPIRKQ